MAAPSFQAQSRRRILTYFGMIILLSIAMVFVLRPWLRESAVTNNLQEVNLGEIDFGGSSARYLLVSLRGPLITGLWWEAIERQKKHEWNQLELLIKTLTKLQPHFRKPWIFQAWNVAYNVSVEFDRIIDKYFYIAEGVQWLVEGERKNRAMIHLDSGDRIVRGDPNMRWEIGHMIQNKMTVSDEKKTHTCLMQLSCIKPENRDPDKLRQNPQLLEEFKKTYPRLVRRIRILKHVPEGVESILDRELLAFLEEYRNLPFHDPSLLPEPTGGAARLSTAFPIWPETMKPDNPEIEEFQDACEVARHWYVFSQEPLPPPNPEPGPVENQQSTDKRYRIPENMSIFIFRAKPAQAESWRAIGLGQEGWNEYSQRAWAEAYELWLKYGRENGLDLDPEVTFRLERLSQLYRLRYPEHANKGLAPTEEMLKDPEIRASVDAAEKLSWRDRNRSLGNYDHWIMRADFERDPMTVSSRNHFYNAAHRWRSDLLLARSEYEKGLELWRQLSVIGINPVSLLDLSYPIGLPSAWLLQPSRLYILTPFGRDKQMQEEIVELQDEYQWLRAKLEAPNFMDAGFVNWQIPRMLAGHGLIGASQIPAIMTIPTLPPPMSLESMEINLAKLPGPLDYFLDSSLRRQIEEKRIERPEGYRPGEPRLPEDEPQQEPAPSPTPSASANP